MGLGAVLANAKDSVKCSYVGGFRRGSKFQTEAPSDIAAYRIELDGMNEFEGLAHDVGVGVGEIVNIATLGYFERKSLREAVYGKNDVDYSGSDSGSDTESIKEGLINFIKKYEAKYGVINIGEENNRIVTNARGVSKLEKSVNSNVNVARKKVDKNKTARAYDTENKETSDDYVGAIIGDDGNDRMVNDIEKAYVMAKEEDAGRVMMYKARERKLEHEENERINEAERLNAYNIKQRLVDEGRATIIENLGVDKYNIPIIKLRMDEILPQKGR